LGNYELTRLFYDIVTEVYAQEIGNLASPGDSEAHLKTCLRQQNSHSGQNYWTIHWFAYSEERTLYFSGKTYSALRRQVPRSGGKFYPSGDKSNMAAVTS